MVTSEIPGRRIGLRPMLLPIPQRRQLKPELQGMNCPCDMCMSSRIALTFDLDDGAP